MRRSVLLALVFAASGCLHAGDPAPGTTAVTYPREGSPSWHGDCDGDGDSDIIDALAAARQAAGLIQICALPPGLPVGPACEARFRGCDVDDNNRIDTIDSLIIAQMDVGLLMRAFDATIINVSPHSPDPTAGTPLSNPVLGAVCLHFYLTDSSAGIATAEVIAEYSTDAGTSWAAANLLFPQSGTPHPTRANVAIAVPVDQAAPATARTVVWDSTANITLTRQKLGGLNVVLRLRPLDSADAPVTTGNEERTNVFPLGNVPPICTIVTPGSAAMVSDQIRFDYELGDDDLVTTPWPVPPYPATDYSLGGIQPEYSTDSGVTWQAMTDGGGASEGSAGLVMGTAVVPAARIFIWDSSADLAGQHLPVTARLRPRHDVDLFTDAVTATLDAVVGAACDVGLILDNNTPPACAILDPAGGATLTGIHEIQFTVDDLASDPVDILWEYSVDMGVTYLTLTPSPGGTLSVNPATSIPTSPAIRTIRWDTTANIPTNADPVQLRGTFTEVGTGLSASCEVIVRVENQPTCAITPFVGPQSGNVMVAIDGTDPIGVGVRATLEYSTDAGATWSSATEGSPSGSIAGNPSGLFSGMATWAWNTQADIPGDMAGVQVRATVDNTVSTSTCSAMLDLVNAPSCVIVPFAPVESGVIQILFTGSDPSADTLTALLEYSVDSGATFASATNAGGGSLTGNPTSPFSAGVQQSWLWDSAVDIASAAGMVILRITVDDGFNTAECQEMLAVSNRTACNVFPFIGSQSGNVTVQISNADPLALPITADFEHSTNGGLTFRPATEGAPPGSITGSPTAPFSGLQTWTWDTQADGVGDLANVVIRANADNGAVTATCSVVVDIVNRPTCTLLPFVAPMGGVITIDLTGMDPSGDTLTGTLEYSTNFGVTYQSPTDAGTGTLTGSPVTMPFASGAAQTWDWDSAADIPTHAASTIFRVTVDDGFGNTSSCQAVVDVINTTSCAIIPFVGPQSAEVTVFVTGTDPFGLLITALVEFSLDGGTTWTVATEGTPPGSITGSPTGPFDGVQTWTWDTQADMIGSALGVIVRATADNGVAATATCSQMLQIDNVPTCSITAPMPLSTQGGVIPIAFTAIDPSADPVTATVAYSTDAGATFQTPTDAGTGTLTGSPTASFTSGSPQSWHWDSPSDIPVAVGATIFEITVQDTSGNSSSCQVVIDVSNQTSCAITPFVGSQSGDVIVQITNNDPLMLPVTATFDYSTDGGVTYAPATDAGGGSITGNPTGPIIGAQTWNWDTQSDMIGDLAGAIIRATVDNGVTVARCGQTVNILNAPSCVMAPTIMGGAMGGDMIIDFGTTDPNPGATLLVRVEYSVNGIVWNQITVGTCGGTMVSNPQAGLAPGATSVCWQSSSDIPGTAMGAQLRVVLDDGRSAPVTTGCVTMGLTIDNSPACTINSPAMGTAISLTQAVNYTTTDLDGDLLLLQFSWSTDAGGSWNGATPSAGTNPTFGFPATRDFFWDVRADLPFGEMGGPGFTTFRIEIYDGTSLSECTQDFDAIPNADPTCNIVTPDPAFPGLGGGDVLVLFDAGDAEGDPLTFDWEYSTDNGMSFFFMTGAPTSGSPGLGQSFMWDTNADIPGVGGCSDGSGGDLVIASDVTIDTTTGMILAGTAPVSGDFALAFDGQLFLFTSITINVGATLFASGEQPLKLLSFGDVIIDGDIDVSGETGGNAANGVSTGMGGAGGPGAGNGGDGARVLPSATGSDGTGLGPGAGGPTAMTGSGGSGAGHVNKGGDSTAAVGGASYFSLPPQVGGSGGGGGGAGSIVASGGGGGGGGGGGVVSITSGGAVFGTGSILAWGGDGGDTNDVIGAGGGGSGGAIEILDDDGMVPGSLTLDVSGGLGGDCAACGPPAVPVDTGDGGDGSPGRTSFGFGAVPCAPGVDIRVSVDDILGGSNSCLVGKFQVDNRPGCSFTSCSPLPGADLGQIQFLEVQISDPTSPSLTVTYEYSTDGGLSWDLPTEAGGALNPRTIAPGTDSFVWDVMTDLGATPYDVPQLVFRVTADDGGDGRSCSRHFRSTGVGATPPAIIPQISTAGHTLAFGPGVDDNFANVVLPFSFPYWDSPGVTAMTSVIGFGTNGGLRMGGGYTQCCSQPPLWTYFGNSAPTIHAHGTDGFSGNMHYFADPTMAVFTYTGMSYYFDASTWSTQVVLLPSGDFQIRQIAASTNPTRIITVGYSDGDSANNAIPGATLIDWDAFPINLPTPLGHVDIGSSEAGGMATDVVLYFENLCNGYTVTSLEPASCAGTVEEVILELVAGPLPIMRTSNTAGADDTVAPLCIPFSPTADHVYQFVPMSTGLYNFSLCGTAYISAIEVRETDCQGAVVACDVFSCFPGAQASNVPLTAGSAYFIIIDGWFGSAGAYTLVIN